MIGRFQKIQSDFGTTVLLKTLLLLIGLVGMAVFGVAVFGRFDAAIIGGVGLVIGDWLYRTLRRWTDQIPTAITVGLVIYGLVLFFGDQIGFGGSTKLSIITLATVLLFDLQFWSLSDTDAVRANKAVD